MDYSLDQQVAEVVHRASGSARACLCDGDASSAVVWDPASEITIRLALRGDEVLDETRLVLVPLDGARPAAFLGRRTGRR